MKRVYITPNASVEEFVANEYVNACYSLSNGKANIYCVLPGANSTTIDGTTPWYYEGGSRGIPHGSCAKDGVLTNIVGHNATGHEGGDKTSVSVTDFYFGEEASNTSSVSGSIGTAPDELKAGKWYKAKWNSTYDGNTYHHIGLVNIVSGTPVRDTANRS